MGAYLVPTIIIQKTILKCKEKISIIERNLHAIYDSEYHLVMVTKYRHPVLTEEVKASLLRHTYRLFETNFDCKVLEVNTDKDHIHIFFSAKPQVQLSKLVNTYKTVTSRLLRKEFASLTPPKLRLDGECARRYSK